MDRGLIYGEACTLISGMISFAPCAISQNVDLVGRETKINRTLKIKKSAFSRVNLVKETYTHKKNHLSWSERPTERYMK